jgi:hypothetical protein
MLFYEKEKKLPKLPGTMFGFHPTALSAFTFFLDFQLFRPELQSITEET